MGIDFKITTNQRKAYVNDIIAIVKPTSSKTALKEELEKVLDDLITKCNSEYEKVIS